MVTEDKKVSGCILCRVPRAKNPYFVENIRTNIYSIEELCYYLYHNLYLADDSILNEGLCVWLEQELGLTSLAKKVRLALNRESQAEEILYPIFKEINYLTYSELKELAVRLSKYDKEAPVLREKQKGDALVENAMYVRAIHVYQDLLKKSNLDKEREGLTEDIYHNLGSAYSYLFQMEKALDCFKNAYLQGKSEKALKTYLLAVRSVKTPIEYQSTAQELGAGSEILDQVTEEINKFAKKPEPTVYAQHIDEMLSEFMADYHRSTGA